MNTCLFADKNVECDLPTSGTERGDQNIPNAAYCRHCEKIAFRCPSGHWNRPFARFCTQCGHKLEKPEAWEMAAANPQRTATVSRDELADSLPNDFGFTSWVVDIPKIESSENLPSLLAIDGLIVVPNSDGNRLDAYKIAKRPGQKQLSPEWSIEFNAPLTYGSTPIYHKLHLFYVVSGGIEKKSVLSGEAEPIPLNDVDSAKIEPAPESAPLKFEIDGSCFMLAPLKQQGALLLDLENYKKLYIKDEFFASVNRPMSPTICGKYAVFTSQRGSIFSFDTETFNSWSNTWRSLSFSAPVSLRDLVYFEVMSSNGARSLACYTPHDNALSKAQDLDEDPPDNFNLRRALFIHPPLTDGERLFLGDRFGETVYTYHSNYKFGVESSLPRDNRQLLFVPHRSVVMDNQIYSAHSAGLNVINLDGNYTDSYQSLAMGRLDDPSPIARPIRYGDKLFILCKDRLVCLHTLTRN